MNQYLELDPKTSDLIMIREKSPNGLSLYRYPKNCDKLVKDNTDQYSW